jgi:hypothetical protein
MYRRMMAAPVTLRSQPWKPRANTRVRHQPWNKGKLVGQKSPLKLEEIWSIALLVDALRYRA